MVTICAYIFANIIIYQIANVRWIIEKAREFQKNIYFCFIDYAKAFDYTKSLWLSQQTVENCQRWEYQTTLPASWEICTQVKKHQLKLDMEQWTGSKLGKEYIKAVYCYPAYLTYMQSTSCKMLGWVKHKLESRLPGEIGHFRDSWESLDCKEIKPVNPKGNQSWIFIGRTDAEAEAPILRPSDAKSWLIRKDPDTGKDWGQEEKGMAED